MLVILMIFRVRVTRPDNIAEFRGGVAGKPGIAVAR